MTKTRLHLCPKCNGQGIVSKSPWVAGDIQQWSSSQTSFTCDICHGKGYKVSAKDIQIGGNHYQTPIQPIDFIVKNDIAFREANIIKYVFRHKKKNGLEDLRKAEHYLQMLIEEYENENN